jgi:hypothetical protein
VWILCFNKISIFLTYLIEQVCLLANLLILLFLFQRLLWCPIVFFILHGFIKLLMLFNVSLLWDQTFVLQLTRSVSLCMLLQMHIGLSLNALCVIFGLRFLLAYISLIVSSFDLHGFMDVDYADSVDDRKSMSGYLIFFW